MKIAAAFTNSFAGWKRLRGAMLYCREHRDVKLDIVRFPIMNVPRSWEIFMTPEKKGLICDFVTEPAKPTARQALMKMDLPAVFFDAGLGKALGDLRRKAFVSEDHGAIARAALEHLDSIGEFKSYAFFSEFSLEGAPKDHWCMARALEFQRLLAARGTDVRLIHGHNPAKTIAKMPRPLAVFAGFDGFATRLLMDCQAEGLNVPDDVSVIGVDDNETYCASTEPGLSSVRPDFEYQGYLAMETLIRLIRSRKPKTINVLAHRSLSVAVRGSTRPSFRYQPTIKAVEEYISSHVAEVIAPDDVARHLGISRRLLDLRLKRAKHATLQTTIMDTKLEMVKTLLTTTTSSIGYLTSCAGFENPNVLKNLFKRRFGVTMRDWRKQNKA